MPSKRYEEICKDSESFRENHDCTVKAVALIADISYGSARVKLAELGRNPRKGCNYTEIALSRLGFDLEDVTAFFKSRTIRTLEREVPKEGRFLVNVSGHILAIIDGEVEDWTKGRMHRITRIQEVVKVSWTSSRQIHDEALASPSSHNCNQE